MNHVLRKAVTFLLSLTSPFPFPSDVEMWDPEHLFPHSQSQTKCTNQPSYISLSPKALSPKPPPSFFFFLSMALSAFSAPSSLITSSVLLHRPPLRNRTAPFLTVSSLSSSPNPSSKQTVEAASSSHQIPSPSKPYPDRAPPSDAAFNYALADSAPGSVVPIPRSTESVVERVIFDFRFFALLAVGGSLAGSVLCFLNGCVYIAEAYKIYWTACLKGIHTGQMVLRLVEAIDVYLAGTVMLIFGMGLYGLFISNTPPEVPADVDRALKGSTLFGMFALKERPKWMKISSLDELKTKVGHVIVMILLVKMFERSKMVKITTGASPPHPGTTKASLATLHSRPVMQMGRPVPTEIETTAEEGEVEVGEDDDMFARGEDAMMV